MSQVFNLSASTLKDLDKLYSDKVIDDKESFVELGIAVGIATGKKDEVKNPKPFHTLSDLDPRKVLSLLATTRNLDLVTEQDVVRELERYAEAGIRTIMSKDIKKNKLNHYKVLKKYSDQ